MWARVISQVRVQGHDANKLDTTMSRITYDGGGLSRLEQVAFNIMIVYYTYYTYSGYLAQRDSTNVTRPASAGTQSPNSGGYSQ